MKILIRVTQEDIDRGERRSCAECPVALAVRRHFLGTPAFSFYENVEIDDGKDRLIAGTPEIATNFMEAFDDGESVSPFSFTLDLQPLRL